MMRQLARVFGLMILGTVGSIGLIFGTMGIVNLMVPVRPPTGVVLMGAWNDRVIARGTWVVDNDRSASPLQITEIFCRRQTMDCRVAQAEVESGGILSIQTHDSVIDQWDSDIITFKDTRSVCIDYAYTINRVTHRVIGTAIIKQATQMCSPVARDQINLTLVDGSMVEQRLRSKARSTVYPFMGVALTLWWAFLLFKVPVRVAQPKPSEGRVR